jgi:phosphate transport system protein
VWERDQEVDAMHELVFRELLTYMTQESRRIALWRRIALCTHLLFCAKNLERMGDHVTNVAESVYYIATRYQLTQARLGPLRPSLGEESRGRALAKAHQPRARR